MNFNVTLGKLFAVSGTMKNSSKQKIKPGPHVLVLLGFNDYDLLRGIFSYAREARWTLDTNYSRIGLTPAPEEQFDGIIAIVGKRRELDVLRQFPGIPCVDLSGAWLWDLRAKGAMLVGRVTYDPAALGRMAVEHLLDRGLRHVAFVNTCNGWHERPAIHAASEETVRRGAKFMELPLHKTIAAHAPYSATRHSSIAMRWLARTLRDLPKPCGIIVVDDWAPHLLRACIQIGISVPADLAVIGLFNHRDACEYAAVPVSSVDADLERIAHEGAHLLSQMMKGTPPPRTPRLIPPKGIVIRQSTDVLAVQNPGVAKAVHFIQRHLNNPLSIEEVAIASGFSRRGLTAAFRRELGESVAQYITRQRVKEAGHLLCETNLKAADVAQRAGFTSLEHLSRVFKKIKGIRPSVYRQKHRRQTERP